MTDTPDSIKIKMLAEAGFPAIPLQEKYVMLVEFVKDIATGRDRVFFDLDDEAKDLLKEIGEL